MTTRDTCSELAGPSPQNASSESPCAPHIGGVSAGQPGRKFRRRHVLLMLIVSALVVGAGVAVAGTQSWQPRSYRLGHDRIGPGAAPAVRLGDSNSMACQASANLYAYDNNGVPSWWDHDAVLKGCIAYLHEQEAQASDHRIP